MLILSLFAVAVLAIAGFAQTIDGDVAEIPQCAINCLSPAITAAGCGQTDWACICGPAKQTIKADALSCIIAACSTADALKAQQLGTQICDIELGISDSSFIASATSTSTQGAATTSASPIITSASSTTTAPSSSTSKSPTTKTTSSSTSFSTTSIITSYVIATSAAPEPSISAAAALLPSKNNLSTGAIAGIAIGASLGGLFLIACMGLVGFGHRKRRKDLEHLAAMSVVDPRRVGPTGPYELCGTSHMNEMSSNPDLQQPGSIEIGMAVTENNQVDRLSEG